MSIHREIHFEDDICRHLAEHGWLYAEGDHERYDRVRALFSEDLLAWVRETQPEAWETLQKNHGANAGAVILDRVREALDQQGTLSVLRHGLDVVGLRSTLLMAQFRPAMRANPEIAARYAANRLRIVRQVRYSNANQNSLDLVLFLNGIPVATAEVKTDFTQNVQDAILQYKQDRPPRTKGHGEEPMLAFPRGALVHFAVSTREVWMTTRLAGHQTKFLPFNRGNDGAAGNPPNPEGYATSYLWEDIWERDGWLEILGRYIVGRRKTTGELESVIFPRYHQLDATRKLRRAVLEGGPGGRYLIQHSAGSGKTNSIAWSAHFLSELHDADNRKLFDTVLVISDRNVIDTQLQDAIFGFQRTAGVVATITGEGDAKSQQLAEALSGEKKVVVCTIQTFPFALAKVRELTAAQGKRFAVIADEAHSSQSGQVAAKLRAVLTDEEAKEAEDGGEISMDDVLAMQMKNRAADTGITFIAFTATPKAKTMELFGTRPDPTRQPASDNIPRPFHVYSMRQAIEEGFILDVLQNYLTYSTAFCLSQQGEQGGDTEVERSRAMKAIMRFVQLHPYNIEQRVEVVVEHFRAHVMELLDGKARAMVVTGSRKEAVRWKLAIDKYIAERGYGIGTLVAFSGEVNDPDTGPDPFTETGPILNPGLRGRSIRDAFKDDAYRILLVANKFQTGFDEPLLCAMYVDKKLAGIQAVQTLSRLNRAYPGKTETYVLDFSNNADDVLAAFKMYYETATLADTTDPNTILDLRAKLDGGGFYDTPEVERVVTVELNKKATQQQLVAALEPVVDRLVRRYQAAQQDLREAEARGDEDASKGANETIEALTLFKRDMGTYVRFYTFLSQVLDFGNPDFEKRALFYRRLIPLLDFGRERAGIDLSQVSLTHYALRNKGLRAMVVGGDDQPELEPATNPGGGAARDPEKARLAELLERVNELFEGELTEQDKLTYVNEVIRGKLLESDVLRQQAQNNEKQQFLNSPDLAKSLVTAIMDASDAHESMSSQALNDDRVRRGILELLLGPGQLYEMLRTRVDSRT